MAKESKVSPLSEIVSPFIESATALSQAIGSLQTNPEFHRFWVDLRAYAIGVQGELRSLLQSPAVSEALANLPEWCANLEANQELLHRAMPLLRSSPYKAIWHLFAIQDVLPYADLTQDQITDKLYEQTSSQDFLNDLGQMYQGTALPLERWPLIAEAISLHSHQSFGGAITMFYAQLEGTLADSLVLLGLAKRRPDGGLQGLSGLHPKLEAAQKASDHNKLYTDLLGNCLVVESVVVQMSASRNAVLHGSDLMFASKQRSIQLVLWFAALLTALAHDSRIAKRAV